MIAARPVNCTWHRENMIVLNTAYGLWRKQIGGEQFLKFLEISYLFETRTEFQFSQSPILSVSLRTEVCRLTHIILIWLAVPFFFRLNASVQYVCRVTDSIILICLAVPFFLG